ncbi:hypothetical protein FACS1894172_00790 [Spirochaetia bacterium]|nr:hypothetical protein FACS1894164_17340 [Spirochaetia bacterium]GHU29510.1 hypothetical protein FACS1894172_00790 [Spirochaetia bacterium]
MIRTIVGVLLLMVVLSGVYAQEGPEEEVNPETELLIDSNPGEATAASPTLPVILRTLVVLLLVAVAIYGLIFVLKRISKSPVPEDSKLKILASVPLGMSRSVHVVSLGEKAWIVGSAEGSISLIAEVTDQEMVDGLILDASNRRTEGKTGKLPSFSQLLHHLPGSGGFNTEKIRKRREDIGRF